GLFGARGLDRRRIAPDPGPPRRPGGPARPRAVRGGSMDGRGLRRPLVGAGAVRRARPLPRLPQANRLGPARRAAGHGPTRRTPRPPQLRSTWDPFLSTIVT